jgi:hypothetical protein
MPEISDKNFIAVQHSSFDEGGMFALKLLDERWVWYRSRKWNIRRLQGAIESASLDKHLGIVDG